MSNETAILVNGISNKTQTELFVGRLHIEMKVWHPRGMAGGRPSAFKPQTR